MKKCRSCSKPATLHITEIREGNVQELHLCETCAQDYLQGPENPDSDVTTGKDSGLAFVDDERLAEIDDLECPNCGITFREFRGQGRLGCPHDYVAFEAELIPLLESIHGETQHCGKLPKRAPDASQRQYQLIRLRNELDAAVEKEEYEEAARLRDEINTIETQLDEIS